jgi:choline dehydrogenase-like flavoprotein
MAHYDVIIIGTGAGGGTLARHLAPSDKKILLIDVHGARGEDRETRPPSVPRSPAA